MLVPGIMLVLTVMSINVFGDGLRDALDPRAQGEDRALMARVHRPARLSCDDRGCCSRSRILTFADLPAIPDGDPALRLAGRTATPPQIPQIADKYGFDKPSTCSTCRTMKNIFTGQAYSYTQGFNVARRDQAGLPATLSLAIGAGLIWLLVVDRRRHARGGQAGPLHRPDADRPVDGRASRSRRSSSARC